MLKGKLYNNKLTNPPNLSAISNIFISKLIKLNKPNNGECSLTVECVVVVRKTRVRLSPFALRKVYFTLLPSKKNGEKMVNKKMEDSKKTYSKQTLSCFSLKNKVITLIKLNSETSCLKADVKQ